jgi:hypothetical protein
MKISFKYLKETKSCYRFEAGSREGGDLTTLYLKKADIDAAGINPQCGIVVTVEEKKVECGQ